MQTANTRPVLVTDHRSTDLTPRGTAILAILRAQELVRELDAADRERVAPNAAGILVDISLDAAPPKPEASHKVGSSCY